MKTIIISIFVIALCLSNLFVGCSKDSDFQPEQEETLDPVRNISEDYHVFINGNPINVFEEVCFDWNRNPTIKMHTTMFDYIEGDVVKVQCNKDFGTYSISPKRLNVQSLREDNTITFTVAETCNYTLRIPGMEPLLLFGAPSLSEERPEENEPNTYIFEKGIHDVGKMYLESNSIYYLEEGAILQGNVYIKNVSNVKVIGRGYIDDRRKSSAGNFLQIHNSKNVTLKGLSVRHGNQGWQVSVLNSEDVYISYLNLLSFGENNDGLDIGVGCKNIHFDDCFIGSGDDGFGWHAIDAAKDGENPTIGCYAKNCLIWKTDVGCGIRIGSSLETKVFTDLNFEYIDIVNNDSGWAIAIPHSDYADISNVTFKNIYDESDNRFTICYIKETKFSNENYRPGTISNVRYINCVSNSDGAEFSGYNLDHMIQNVTFENVTFNGRAMLQSDIKANEFTKSIVVVD